MAMGVSIGLVQVKSVAQLAKAKAATCCAGPYGDEHGVYEYGVHGYGNAAFGNDGYGYGYDARQGFSTGHYCHFCQEISYLFNVASEREQDQEIVRLSALAV